MITTPITDKYATDHIGFYTCATVPASVCREIERERDALRAALELCETSKGACGYRNSEYAFRRLDEITRVARAALAMSNSNAWPPLPDMQPTTTKLAQTI